MNADIQSLTESADRWEFAGYCAAAVVLIGVILESVHIISLLLRGKAGGHIAEIMGFSLLVLGLTAEILTQVQSNNKTGLIIGYLSKEEADLRLELAKLDKPRSLSPDQQARAAVLMSRFGGLAFNATVFNTKEALDLLDQVEKTMVKAGLIQIDWPSETSLTRTGKPRVGFTTEKGVTIQVDDSELAPLAPVAKVLASALRAEGIEAEWVPMTTSPHHMNRQTFHLVIGRKP